MGTENCLIRYINYVYVRTVHHIVVKNVKIDICTDTHGYIMEKISCNRKVLNIFYNFTLLTKNRTFENLTEYHILVSYFL
jgi:hypothetical protein